VFQVADVRDNIFREYDIRGIFGHDLTIEVAELIGRAYAVYIRKKGAQDPITVSIGRDVRVSSTTLKDALIKGLTESGINCVDIGECPTPLQYFSMQELGQESGQELGQEFGQEFCRGAGGEPGVQGGLMITGSHNPPEYNGFKISVGSETIHGEEIQTLKKIIREEVLSAAPDSMPAVPVGGVTEVPIIPGYIDYVSSRFTLPALAKPIKVVLDGGNGTAGPVAPPLLRRLGCDVVELYCTPDGSFPNHHPDPTVPENLVDLMEAVKKEGADFGVAFDGDSDRIGVVDEEGGIVWGDKLMVIFARGILETTPGATIVGEVKCSQVMYDEIKRQGGNAVMWKTGHSLIKAKMKELKAAVAGEMSGHIFFADRYFGFDDAVYATCRLVEILAGKRAADERFAFSDLLKGLPSTHVTPEVRVDCPDELKFEVIERLDNALGQGAEGIKIKDVIKIDGLRINFEGGWALVRASNTQPVLVFRFEAATEKLLNKARAFMKTKLAETTPGIGTGI
jgi:phosphomannomutase/phosphoglucomutase